MTVRQLMTQLEIIVSTDATAAELLVEVEEYDPDEGGVRLVPAKTAEPRNLPDGSRRLVIIRGRGQ